MFRLLRYFSLTSAITLVVVAIILAFFYREHAVDDLVDITERKNETLARSFANAIWPRYAPFVASVGALDGDELRARDETRELHETLRRLADELPVLKVKIYDLEGLTVYSSEIAEIGEDKSGNPGFVAAARQGMPASKLIERGTFNAFEGVINVQRDLVESYLPIRGDDGRIEGVFELYTDVTPLVAHVQEMTAILLGGIILLFGAVYGVLLLIVWRAGRVPKRQYGELESGKKLYWKPTRGWRRRSPSGATPRKSCAAPATSWKSASRSVRPSSRRRTRRWSSPSLPSIIPATRSSGSDEMAVSQMSMTPRAACSVTPVMSYWRCLCPISTSISVPPAGQKVGDRQDEGIRNL